MTSPEAEAQLDRVREFVESHIAPAAPGWSMGADPDPALFAAAGELGVMGIEIPERLGGLDLGFRQKVRVCEIVAEADFGISMAMVNIHNVAARLCRTATPRIIEKYVPRLVAGTTWGCTALTEPGAGSDFASIRTQAVKTDAGWLLNGEKAWIINGRRAEVAVVFAQCGEIGDMNGIGAFVVDLTAPGASRYAIDGAFSQTSIGTGGFTMENVEIEEDCQLLAPGKAFKTVLTEINGARTYVGAMCIAMLRAAIAEAAAYGEKRRTFGKKLSEHPTWQAMLTSAEAGVADVEAIIEEAVDLIDAGKDAQLPAAEAKVRGVEVSQQHLPHMLHAMGAEGLRPEYCFARHLGAAQVAGFTDGATNMLRDRVAKLKQAASAD